MKSLKWEGIGTKNLFPHTSTTTPVEQPLSSTTYMGKPAPDIGKTSLDLNEATDDGVLACQWHQLDHMQTVCTSLQTDNHTNTSSLNVYRLDALPGAQPTVSKH